MLRPQTWYLLLAAISMLVCAIVGGETSLQLVLLIVATMATVAVVPLFKNRKLQAGLCLLPLALLLAWYVVLATYATADAMKWQYALPLLAMALVFLARKGILHDEKVVRSLDRIR